MMKILWTTVLVFALPVIAMAGERFVLDEAGVEQLAGLEHVDQDLANRIVALRQERGGHLNSVEDLRILEGIGDSALDELRGAARAQVVLVTNLSSDKTWESAEEVLAAFGHEPVIAQVQSWAANYARVNPGRVDRWLRSSRTFAVLPQLRFEYKLDDGWDNDFTFYAVDGAVDQPGEESFEFLEDAGIDQDQTIKVVATWDLDKLIMSSEQIRVINESQDIVKLREKVLTEVTRLYFERRRVQVEMMLSPKSVVMEQVKDQLRLMELTANIDAVTGGAFSQALSRAKGD